LPKQSKAKAIYPDIYIYIYPPLQECRVGKTGRKKSYGSKTKKKKLAFAHLCIPAEGGDI
jgi:hypothetical protein